MIWILIITIVIITEIKYSPRLDYTKEENLLLWYNGDNGKREYKKIF